MTDLATLTAILYGARMQRRIPESDAERLCHYRGGHDWMLSGSSPPSRRRTFLVPPPRSSRYRRSPGALGRTIADVKETRRRVDAGVGRQFTL